MNNDLATLGLSLQADWQGWLRELVDSTTVEFQVAVPLDSLYPTIAPLVRLEEEMAELMRSLTTNFLPTADSVESSSPPFQETSFPIATPSSNSPAPTYPHQFDSPWGISDITSFVPASPPAKAPTARPDASAHNAELFYKQEKSAEFVSMPSDASLRAALEVTTPHVSHTAQPPAIPSGDSSIKSSELTPFILANYQPPVSSPQTPSPEEELPTSTTSIAGQFPRPIPSPAVPQSTPPLESATAPPDSIQLSTANASTSLPTGDPGLSQRPSLFSGSFPNNRSDHRSTVSKDVPVFPTSTASIGTLQDFAKALSTAPWTVSGDEDGSEALSQTPLRPHAQPLANQPGWVPTEPTVTRKWQEMESAIANASPTVPSTPADQDLPPDQFQAEAFQQAGSEFNPSSWKESAKAEAALRSGLDPPLDAAMLDPDQILEVIQDAINRDYRRFYGA